MSEALTLEAQPGLDEGTLGALRSARSVALARRHSSPVELAIDDAGNASTLALPFQPPGARELSAWSDPDRTTEWAGEAIALEVVHATRKLGVVQRAARGTRFDWFVGPPGADLETAVALEIGGTDAQPVERILAKKLTQLRKRASGLPGIAVAVQLLTPRAMLGDG